MSLVWISEDEWYPVYSSEVDTPLYHGHPTIEVEAATLARWQEAEKEFLACQDEMAKASEHARDRRMDKTERGERIIPTWPPRPSYQ